MASRFRVPRQPTPQPDRDFDFGSRPQDTLNRVIPGQQGLKGTMAGLGQANSFKPRQVGMQRRTPPTPMQTPQPAATRQPAGVKMSFAGDPSEIARAMQALVNNTGTHANSITDGGGLPTDPSPSPTPDPLAPSPIGIVPGDRQPGLVTDPGPGPVITDPGGGSGVPGPTVPAAPPTTLPPAVSNPGTEFNSLTDYLNAVGGIDLIDETAYKTYGDWVPQLPEFAQQKIALDNQLQSQLVAAVGSQETAKAMQKLILSRLIEDEMSDQATNRAVAGSRGLSSSSIKEASSQRINKGYMREAGNNYSQLVNDLMGYGQGLAGNYGTYLSNILGLSSDEAQALYDAGLGAGSLPATADANENDTETNAVEDEIGTAKRIKRKKKKG